MPDGPTRNQPEKIPYRRCRLSWGSKLTLALIGASVSWTLVFIQTNSQAIPQILSLHDLTRQTAPFFGAYSLGCVFSAWIVILIVEVFLPFDIQSVGLLTTFLPVALPLLLGFLLRHRWDPAAVFFITVIPAILVYTLALTCLNLWVKRSVRRGDFDRAFRLSRPFAAIDPSGCGWMLLQAGRYREAARYLRPCAFGKDGRPRLTDINLYYYAMALLNTEEFSECQELLESAVSVSQDFEHFHIALADCLLSQNKDAERAHSIIGEVLARFSMKPNRPHLWERKAVCIALDAWALARCGLGKESELQIEMARRLSKRFVPRDSAVVEHLIGTAWLALGDSNQARSAFLDTLKLFPRGDIGLRARRSLDSLERSS